MPAEPGEQALSTNTGSSDEAAGETIDININTATAADLEMLPGIGEVMAQRIIDHRTENGAFRTIEDLQQVPGIGPVLLENIRAYVRVE
jgi:competence protein ComEA